MHYFCRNPTLWECEDETHTPEIGTWEPSRTPKISEFDCRGQNTSHWNVFISLESYRSVDVENGLAWAIWISATQVMVEKKVGSQTSNLTPNHQKSGIDLTLVCAGQVKYTVGKLLRRATSLL
jgi:hypothetical protein